MRLRRCRPQRMPRQPPGAGASGLQQGGRRTSGLRRCRRKTERRRSASASARRSAPACLVACTQPAHNAGVALAVVLISVMSWNPHEAGLLSRAPCLTAALQAETGPLANTASAPFCRWVAPSDADVALPPPQEKMTTMEAEINEKDKVITSLREENSALAGRNAVLEKVLALREEQLKSFQPGGAAAADQVGLQRCCCVCPRARVSAPGGKSRIGRHWGARAALTKCQQAF